MNDVAKWAYMAGIIDGEGSISVEKKFPSKRKKFPHYVARLTITNTNYDVLKWICDNFGGKLFQKQKGSSLGKKDCFFWYAFGEKLEEILKGIQPYSIIKKPHITNTLAFRQTVGKTGQHISQEMRDARDKFYMKSRSLNSCHNKPSAVLP